MRLYLKFSNLNKFSFTYLWVNLSNNYNYVSYSIVYKNKLVFYFETTVTVMESDVMVLESKHDNVVGRIPPGTKM